MSDSAAPAPTTAALRAFLSHVAPANDLSLDEFLRRVPKVDLHCHLNGSISAPLLEYLSRVQAVVLGKPPGDRDGASDAGGEDRAAGVSLDPGRAVAAAPQSPLSRFPCPERRMQYCFTVFDNVYRIMTNLAFTRLAVQDLLLYSAAENMCVVEIRSSLRASMTRSGFPPAARAAADAGAPVPHAAMLAAGGFAFRYSYAPPCGDADVPVTKKDYVYAVIETVEHLLRGGVVCFETGALQSLCPGKAGTRRWMARFAEMYSEPLRQLVPSAMGAGPGDGAHAGACTDVALVDFLMRRLTTQLVVRLTVSVNRGDDVAAAGEAVGIAREVAEEQLRALRQCVAAVWEPKAAAAAAAEGPGEVVAAFLDGCRRTCWVTSVDFSGNCYRNTFRDFVPALTLARQPLVDEPHGHRLRVTLHAGEKHDEAELAEMVAFQPDRWGHLVMTGLDTRQAILRRHDPIELCLTSNLLTGGSSDIRSHHIEALCIGPSGAYDAVASADTFAVALLTDVGFANTLQRRVARRLRRLGDEAVAVVEGAATLVNVSINTDDRGVFGTSMKAELALLATHPLLQVGQGPDEGNALSPAMLAMWSLERLALAHVAELPPDAMAFAGRWSAASGDPASVVELHWLLRHFDQCA